MVGKDQGYKFMCLFVNFMVTKVPTPTFSSVCKRDQYGTSKWTLIYEGIH